MADYSRYKTETLKKMFDKALGRYIRLTASPAGDEWGFGMRHNKLSSLSNWARASERCESLAKEIGKRTGYEPVWR